MNAVTAQRVGYDMSLLTEACNLTVKNSTITECSLQRRMRIGFAKAGRLMDLMEEIGVVGPPKGTKPRDVLAKAADLPSLLETP